MATMDPARHSSGIYDGAYGGPNMDYGSTTSLARNAANPDARSRFSEAPSADGPSASNETFDPAAGAGAGAGYGAAGAGAGYGAAGAGAAAAPVVYKPPFYLRRWFLITTAVLGALGLALLFIILFPVVKAIAQLVVDRSVLNIDVASITSPQNGTFTLGLNGTVSHTGIFAAKIAFTEAINISWKENATVNTPLGYFALTALAASHKRAYINQTTQFMITDQDAFGRFSAHLITAENFTWNLRSDNLKVQAIKFPVDHGIHFNKDLTLPAINNFQNNVILESLELPSDNPSGGINFVATTILYNPSPFALDLGTVNFGLSFQDIFLGVGTGTNTQLRPGNNSITLAGTLEPQYGAQNLSQISTLFTNYINGENSDVQATGISTTQADGTQISWLSAALQSLVLAVPFKPLEPIVPIRSIAIGELGLSFTEATEWAPAADSNSVEASLVLPFGFGLEVEQIQNAFEIVVNGSSAAELTTPVGASTSSIDVVNATYTYGNISIDISNGQLSIPDASHALFSAFTAELTDGTATTFQLIGNSSAVANTSVGLITLDPIKVNVSTSLDGLRGLKGLTTISTVDVVGGTSDAITLAIGTDIYNPSSLVLGVGDLTLQLFRGTSAIGTALLANLSLAQGNNTLSTVGSFDPNGSPAGQLTLDQFVGGTDVDVDIAGFSGSTQIESLLQAFETLNISVVLPALKTPLLESAALIVLPTTGVTNNISEVTVNLVNPFTAGLEITKITSSVTSHGINLGSIATTTQFTSQGKATTTSPQLDLNLNFDPNVLFTLTRVLAVQAGESTTQLDGIVQLGGYSYVASTSADSAPPSRRELEERGIGKRNIYTGFDLVSFVDTAFKQLRSDVQLEAEVTIGEYTTTLNYTQLSVPITTDSTLNYLLPVLARPIVQKIVNAAAIGIETVLITDPAEGSFGTTLKGSITNAGPFDAVISFPQGLTVSWNGAALGALGLEGVNVVGDVGATLDTSATFTVTSVDQLTAFTKVLLTEESFEWDISAENLTVSALGINVTGISLPTKKVSLKGFNGLKGGVTIQSFDLPSNDPAGGITLTLETTVANPSQVGISLSTIGFNAFYDGVNIGPVASSGAFTLNPQSTSPLPLAGRLIPQTSSSGLAAVSSVFNNFIHGENSNVSVTGASAGPSSVTWLNEGIQALSIDTTLPNQGKLNIITAVDLVQLSLMFTQPTEYNPATSTNDTTADFTLPFNFPVDIVGLEQNITASYNGQSFAELIIPEGPAKTDVGPRVIHLTFSDVPFAANNDGVFSNFLAATTLGTEETLTLTGNANAMASTGVGTLSLEGITFSVQSSIAGLQGLDASPVSVSDLDVAQGTTDYLLITVNTVLYNPSNLTIGTGDVSFGLQFDGATIGEALLSGLVIVPGNVTYPTNVHYQPTGSAVTQGKLLLENYIQGVDSQTTIQGSTGSTPIASLQQALSQIKLSPVTIPALHQPLITSATLEFPTDIVTTGIAQASFVLDNPFTASINIEKLTTTAIYNGLTLGMIENVDVSSHPITAAGHANITSPALPLNFNLNPIVIIQLIAEAAAANNVNLGPLEQLFQIVLSDPNFTSSITSSVDTGAAVCVSGNQFDVDDAILNALKNLKVDLAITSSLKLDEYATDLSFNQSGVTAITDKTALYLIGAVAPPIVQNLVDGAVLKFTEANITNLSDGGFDLALVGSLTNIGPLDAKITFAEPIVVNWQGNDIATIALPPVCASANTGVPNYVTSGSLAITDLNRFTSFATYLLHNPSFTWTITTPKLQVEALGTIFYNVSLQKDIELAAFNGLPGVTISNFQLPSDDPAGGIHIETDALIPSPAQLGIDLGTVGFLAYYDNVEVGPLSGSNLFLAADTTTSSHLTGRIIPQSGSNLNTIGQLFTEYLQADSINLIAKGDSVVPTGSSTPVSWLSAAFKTLSLPVVLKGQRYNIIDSIDIHDFRVEITTQAETYAPLVGSNSTLATYQNPFGFSLQVVQSAVDMIIALPDNGTQIATLTLPTSNTVGGVSTGNVADLPITFHNLPLKALDDTAMQELFEAVTDTPLADLTLEGSANVTAKTTIGNVPIASIPFNVQSSLTGLNGLKTQPVTVSDLVVASGTPDYLLITINTDLFNPSNITLETSDVTFALQFENATIGSAILDPLLLVPGNAIYATQVHYDPQGSAVSAGQQLLANYVQGVDSQTTIQGTMSSSPYASLQPALSLITLSPVTIPALHQQLIPSTTLEFPINISQTGIAQASFVLDNPFQTSINILQLSATATYLNLTLGKINNVDLSSNPITAAGHQNITSPSVPFDFNLDPMVIIELIFDTAQANGVNLGPLVELFEIALGMPNFQTNITSVVDTGPAVCVSGQQFDVDDAILDSLKGLKVNLTIESNLKLDEYPTGLTFNQYGVSAITDKTALYLIGAAAPPIVQNLVDGADLAFTGANITNLTNSGFTLDLAGSLTNIGPLDAKITFAEPVIVNWEGTDIANIALPSVCAAANTGVPTYNPTGQLTILDLDAFTTFTSYLLHNPSFTWTIHTDKLQVEALGTIFSNVILEKNVTLAAFNGLPGVTISNFSLPSDDPAGGIHIDTDASIPSPAQIGIDLGTATFLAYYNGVEVGPLSTDNLNLPPMSNVTTELSGRIIPQSGSDADVIGQLFTQYLQADAITLIVKGDSVVPPGTTTPITWLSNAFQTLNISVVLQGQKFTIIESIAINDFQLEITTDAETYAPLVGSTDTLATYKNPFGFSLQVIESAVDLTIGFANNGTQIGTINLPSAPTVGGVSTGNVADLPITFSNATFQASNDAAMQTLFQAVTDTPGGDLTLQGTANVTAKTSSGNIPIGDIPFNVPSSLAGINGFGGTAQLANLSVSGSGGANGNQYVIAPLTTTLQNPSNISLVTNDIALPVTYQGVQIGRAAISPFNLVPGTNVVPTQFEYMPADPNNTIAQGFITSVLQTGDTLPLTVQGDADSSPYASLQPALEGITLNTSITGLNVPPLIAAVQTYISITGALATGYISASFDIFNPLPAPLKISFVQADAYYLGTNYAHFDQAFDDFVVPPGETVNSGIFDGVFLTQGIINSLIIVGENLDIESVATATLGDGGYTFPWLQVNNADVPTAYNVTLTDIIEATQSIASASSTSAASSSIASASLNSSASATSSISLSLPLSLSSSSSAPISASSVAASSSASSESSSVSSAAPSPALSTSSSAGPTSSSPSPESSNAPTVAGPVSSPKASSSSASAPLPSSRSSSSSSSPQGSASPALRRL